MFAQVECLESVAVKAGGFIILREDDLDVAVGFEDAERVDADMPPLVGLVDPSFVLYPTFVVEAAGQEILGVERQILIVASCLPRRTPAFKEIEDAVTPAASSDLER